MKVSKTLVLLAAFAAPAGALSSELVAWGAGPVSFLMTESERATWQAIVDDDAAREFVATFWSRRDPTPETPENEVRDEYQERVAWAEKFLSTPDASGAMGDRGRLLIVLGAPSKVERSGGPEGSEEFRAREWLARDRHPPGEAFKGEGGAPPDLDFNPFAEGAAGAGSPSREVWIYEPGPVGTSERKLVVRFQRAPGRGQPELAQRRKVLALLAAEVEWRYGDAR
jgi:GWxTD domain-containing protein